MFNFTTGTRNRQRVLPTQPGTGENGAASGIQGRAGAYPASGRGALPQTAEQGQIPGQSGMQNQMQGQSGMQGQVPGQNLAQSRYIDQRIDEIEAQRQAFARQNPNFDMRAEMENPAFVNYVWGNGLSIEDAYFLVHREELLEQAGMEAVQEMLERRNRISENGAAKNRPAIARKNPKDLSDKEVDDIIERARRGEKISF
ncbi:hypothetical protein [Ructibacterium gallinarum]|uniref:Uncharacterized protein n=1 Tax=Ructibacterium gallinarum TaxID=2779355 RepID=A0A9D5M5G1_9FIRM|nr:hypothetical protein [Ructibacterium gallinarum]MBE5039889.1 hypothetical protein [Ructibacterium gallinarum]